MNNFSFAHKKRSVRTSWLELGHSVNGAPYTFHSFQFIFFICSFATQHKILIKKNIDSNKSDFEFDFFFTFFFLLIANRLLLSIFSHKFLFFITCREFAIYTLSYQLKWFIFGIKFDIEWLQNNNNNNIVLIHNMKAGTCTFQFRCSFLYIQ